MKRRGSLLTIVTAAAIGCGSAAYGQQFDPWQNQQQQQGQFGQQQQQLNLALASDLINERVYDRDGNHIGNIREIVISQPQNQVAYVMVEEGRLLGNIAGDWHAVPVAALNVIDRMATPHVWMDLTAEQFDRADGYSRWEGIRDDPFRADPGNRWPDRANPYFAQFIRSEQAQQQPQRFDRFELYRFKDIAGNDIENVRGSALGELEDAAIDLDTGAIVYGIASYGGFFGFGEKLAVIPWAALQPRLEQGLLVIDTRESSLERTGALAVDDLNRERLSDLQTARQLYSRFDQADPSVYGFAGEQARDQRQFQAGQFDQTRQQQMLTLRGEITSVDERTLQTTGQEHLRLRVRTEQGQTVTVYGPPADQLDQLGVDFNRGDQVTVTGAQTRINGESALQGQRISTRDHTISVQGRTGQQQMPQRMR